MAKNDPQKVGDSADVTNINAEKSNQMWDMASGNTDNLFASLMGFDPAATFGNAAGQAGDTARSFMQPYQNEMMGLLNSQITSRVRGAEGMFAGSGQSGAQQSAIARGIAEPIAQASTQMAGLGAQLGGNMLGQRLGMDQMAYGGKQNMYGLNMNAMGQQAAPEWWQPSYMEGGGGFDWGSMLGTALGGTAGFLLGGPGGAVVGAGMGGGMGRSDDASAGGRFV